MKLFSFFSALLFAAFAENARSSAGPTKWQRAEAAQPGSCGSERSRPRRSQPFLSSKTPVASRGA